MDARTGEHGRADLPEGWHWERDGKDLVWRRAYGVWVVELTCPMAAPFFGPSELRVWAAIGGPTGEEVQEAIDEADKTDGIPSSVVTSIPLSEIKQQARRIIAATGEPWPVPERCITEEDYALLAAELVRIKATGTGAPQQVLAERLGIGKATMSDRVRRARELELLEWKDHSLTAKGATLAAEVWERMKGRLTR